MTRLIGAALALALVSGLVGTARAADKDTDAILDKAIKALGGQDNLSKAKNLNWKSKGTITIMGADNPFTTSATAQGLDHFRSEIEGEFGGNKFQALSVLAGDKGWRKFAGNVAAMDKDAVANEKRTLYLNVIPMTVLPLRGNGFKVSAAGEEKVGDKPAVVLKVIAPDGKDFKLYFDKQSGLPVKSVAKVIGLGGDEFTQETYYSDYKDMGGIKKAAKVQSKRNGEKFLDATITEFRPLEKIDAKTFEEPK
jgi:hypothetical protein